jgi:hypothetical protein
MEELLENILSLVKKKMQEQGGYSRDAYSDFIDETIEYYRQKGLITDDDNEEFIKDRLLEMWGDVEEEMTKKY